MLCTCSFSRKERPLRCVVRLVPGWIASSPSDAPSRPAEGEGDNISQTFLCRIWKKRTEHPDVGDVSIRSRNGASSRK